jgi:hypothetical protein
LGASKAYRKNDRLIPKKSLTPDELYELMEAVNLAKDKNEAHELAEELCTSWVSYATFFGSQRCFYLEKMQDLVGNKAYRLCSELIFDKIKEGDVEEQDYMAELEKEVD